MNGYNPARRKRCVSVAWRKHRRVRILHPAFGYKGKIGAITNVGPEYVYVLIKTGRTLWDRDEVAYLPDHLKLI